MKHPIRLRLASAAICWVAMAAPSMAQQMICRTSAAISSLMQRNAYSNLEGAQHMLANCQVGDAIRVYPIHAQMFCSPYTPVMNGGYGFVACTLKMPLLTREERR